MQMNASLSSHKNPLRVSCDFCRLKKLRCSGERPACARCSSSERHCTYSTQRPLGRPRRSLALRESQPAFPKSHKPFLRERNALQSSTQTPSNILTLNQQSSFNLTLHSQLDSYERNDGSQQESREVDLSIPATSQTMSQSSQECACLSILYLTLDQVRVTREYQFPRDLRLLSEAVSTARTILSCEICPQRWVTAMLNSQGLGMLVVSVAEGYSKIFKSLKSTENQGVASRLLYLGIPNEATTMESPLSMGVEVSLSEWMDLMRRALRTEVFGAQYVEQWTIMSLIDKLEERQRSWHLHPPSDDFPSIYQQTCDKHAPACLVLAGDARRIIANLKF